MTHRVWTALGRLRAPGVAAALALLLTASALAAQETSGKLQGTVSDQQGAPLANAQVLVVGTSFGATTNDRGYYFINNVPVGSFTLRAQLIGWAPAEVTGVRVLGGQTITQDVRMQSSAVVVTGITVTAAENPIVPRDQVTSKTIISGQLIDDLPVNDLRQVVLLEPGVVESNRAQGLSIRGGRPGEAATYVDGVLVRNSQRGETSLNVGTNAVEEVSVTTGAMGAEFGEAQSGIFAATTRAGGQRLQGAVAYQTDDMGLWDNVGFNRFEASVGGPLTGKLTWFVATTITGQKSINTAFDRDLDRPVYVASGVDTVIHQPATVGDPLSDTVLINVPRFVQYSGDCPAGASSSATQAKRDIASNYGVECQGLRLPLSANGGYTANAKLQYSYGTGSRLSVTGLTSQDQQRLMREDAFAADINNLYNPSNQSGRKENSFAAIANWTHNLSRSAERAMALDVNFSYQVDKRIEGPLTGESELDSRDPFGGFLLSPLDFRLDFNTVHDVTIAGTTYQGVRYLDDLQVQCLQAGEAACQDGVPFLNRNDLLSAQPYRMNPYAAEQSARLPLWVQGADRAPFLGDEKRFQVRGNFDWQADRFNRVKLGAEFHSFDTRRYSPGSMVSAFGLNAYHEKPQRLGAYIEDRLDLGDVVLVGGLRYDYFDARTSLPYTPARISSDTLPFDPTNPDANYVAVPSHSAWSPRVQVSFPVTERTNFRLSYAHQVQAPDYNLIFTGKNTDLQQTNRNQVFGRDLDFTKTIIFEFGIRHAFSQDMVLDVAAYNKDKVSDVAGRLVQLADPGLSGATGDFRVYQNADFGNVRGVDMKLDRRFSNLFSGSVAYTFQVAKNTGSDPNSYFRTTARVISTLTGETAPPPQAILSTDDNRTHTIAGAVALTFPGDWRQGSTIGTVLKNVGVFATFRFASGLPYTRIRNSGEGVIQGAAPLEFTNLEPINSSTMPWIKNFDLRLTKGFRTSRLDWTVFLESRNLFNFKNTNNVFIETGDVVNAQHRARFVDEQVAQLLTEAAANGIATVTDPVTGQEALDFSVPGICAGWAARNTPGSAAGGPVDCVLITRAEARYGNGDGLYAASEYTAAFNAWYNLANAPSQFYGPGRRIRVGAELAF